MSWCVDSRALGLDDIGVNAPNLFHQGRTLHDAGENGVGAIVAKYDATGFEKFRCWAGIHVLLILVFGWSQL
jgi:hypothetical protein